MKIGSIACLVHFMSIVYVQAQDPGFSHNYYFDERSTSFKCVFQDGDDIRVIGEIGPGPDHDQEFFILQMDTLGEILDIDIYGDPTETDQPLIHQYRPYLLKDNGHIVTAGSMWLRNTVFLQETNSEGDVIWFQEYPSNFLARYVYYVLQIGTDLYIVSRVQDQDSFSYTAVQKVDSAGIQLWEKTYGIPMWSNGARGAIVEDYGITLLNLRARDPNPHQMNDYLKYTEIIHIDTVGQVEWTWESDLSEEETTMDLRKYRDGYIYALRTTHDVELHLAITGGQIVRRDSDFEVVWRKDYTDTLFLNMIHAIDFGPDSMLYAIGNVYEQSVAVWGTIWKIDPENGDVIWSVQDTGMRFTASWTGEPYSQTNMEGITILPTGSVIAAGHAFDRTTQHYHGYLVKVSSDGCIVDTLCTTTSIVDFLNNQQERLMLYPNPTSGAVTFEWNSPVPEAKLHLINMHGQIVSVRRIQSGEAFYLDSNLPAGPYIWHVLGKESGPIGQGKLILMR